MLVLSTKMEDSVQIGDDIRITVIDIRPRNVRLGIEAPQSISIKRDPAAPRHCRTSNVNRSGSSPQAPSRSHNGNGLSTVPSERSNSPHDAAGMSVLVVSRDQPLLSRLKTVLGQCHTARAFTASSITDGKRRIAAQQAVDPHARPDLVLLDVDLSPQTAILFLRWLRQGETRRLIPVLAMRSEATPHSTATLLAAGANVVVSKVLPWDRLGRSVCAAIELWQDAESKPESRNAAHGASLQECVA